MNGHSFRPSIEPKLNNDSILSTTHTISAGRGDSCSPESAKEIVFAEPVVKIDREREGLCSKST